MRPPIAATIQSMGLYSTWIHLPEYGVAFDCGEGMTSNLRFAANSIEHLFLSHEHHDHTAGLLPLLFIRSSMDSGSRLPINIYYPANSRGIANLRNFIEKQLTNDQLQRRWIPLTPGQETVVAVSDGLQRKPTKIVRAFEVNHGSTPAFGYSFLEPRRKRNPKYQHLSQREIAEISNANNLPEDFAIDYKHKLLVYSGDAYKMPLEEARHADFLIHDATFLSTKDRTGNKTHASVKEVLAFAKEAQIKRQTFLIHISPRYLIREVKEFQETKLPAGTFIQLPLPSPIKYKLGEPNPIIPKISRAFSPEPPQ